MGPLFGSAGRRFVVTHAIPVSRKNAPQWRSECLRPRCDAKLIYRRVSTCAACSVTDGGPPSVTTRHGRSSVAGVTWCAICGTRNERAGYVSAPEHMGFARIKSTRTHAIGETARTRPARAHDPASTEKRRPTSAAGMSSATPASRLLSERLMPNTHTDCGHVCFFFGFSTFL